MEIPKSWTFKNPEIAENFDAHVREQLPWYDLCADAVEHITRNYLPENGLVYDVGASTGNINKILSGLLKERNAKYIGIDNSPDMIKEFAGSGEIILADAVDFDFKSFDVCILFLVTMFLPKAKHEMFIDRLMSKINIGGIIIVIDKAEQEGGYLSTVISRLSMREKMKTVSASEILNKEMSLSGIQRPIGISIQNKGREFFRFGDFIGFIIESDGANA